MISNVTAHVTAIQVTCVLQRNASPVNRDPETHLAIRSIWSNRRKHSPTIQGDAFKLIPLRNRWTDPEGNELLTRISEGMTQWTLEDGRVGYGLSEYLDQIIDAMPVGYDGPPTERATA